MLLTAPGKLGGEAQGAGRRPQGGATAGRVLVSLSLQEGFWGGTQLLKDRALRGNKAELRAVGKPRTGFRACWREAVFSA